MPRKQQQTEGYPIPTFIKHRFVVMIEQREPGAASFDAFHKKGIELGWQETQDYRESGNDLVVTKECMAPELIADVELLRPYLPENVVTYVFVVFDGNIYSVWDAPDGKLYSDAEIEDSTYGQTVGAETVSQWDRRKARAERLVRHLEKEWLKYHPTNPIEPGVRPLVILLNALGLRTTGSSEGDSTPDGMRMTKSFVDVWIDRDEPEQVARWSRIMCDMLLMAPTTSMNNISIARDGRGEYLFTISIRYTGHFPHQEKIKRMAISQLVEWLDANGPRYLEIV